MFNLTLNDQEKAYLQNLLQADAGDTRVEVRRTDNPTLHDDLLKREEMIQGLLKKLTSATGG